MTFEKKRKNSEKKYYPRPSTLDKKIDSSICYLKSLNVIKEMVSVHCATIELYMHLGGLLSIQEARVALGYRLVRLLRFFRA